MIQVWNPDRPRDLSFLQKCPDWLWDPPISLFNGYRAQFLLVLKLTTHPLVLKLRMSGAQPQPLNVYFVACIGTSLPLL
jgi:hypothetical protein